MRARSLAWMTAQFNSQAAPLPIVALWTQQGARLYSMVGLTDAEVWAPAASPAVIERGPRLLSTSRISDDMPLLVLGGMGLSGARQCSDFSCTLRNDDDYFGKLLAVDILLSATITFVLGWRGEAQADFLACWQGIVVEHTLTGETLTLRGEVA